MLDRLRHEDDGFTLVETLAAMIVFAILAVSVAGVILNGFELTKSNASRSTAANLASQQIEAARSVPPASIPDGMTVTGTPIVNGIRYQVAQTANVVAESSTSSLCTGTGSATGASLAYKLVTVTVTWPSMGRVQPVRQDTLLSLGVAGYDKTKGIAAVGVTGADGRPVSGVTVTLGPSGTPRVTGVDGCAVFTGLTPGSYSAKVDQDGFVTPAGSRASSTTFTVAADSVVRVPMAYDRVGALAMALVGPAGLVPPPNLSMTLASAGFSPTSRTFLDCASVSTAPYDCVSGSPRTASRLWPGSYDVKPGACPVDDTSAAQAVVARGATSSVTLPLAGARAEVWTKPVAKPPSPASPATGHTVYAVRAGNGSCPTQSWPMTPAGASTQSLALPPGTWTFALTADASGADPSYPWPTATLTIGGAVPTVVVTVP